MKKTVLLGVGMFACALLNAHAQNTIIYSTYDDWTNWNGAANVVSATNTFDYDGVLVNGIGNPSAPGVTSSDGGGSLELVPITPGYGAYSSGTYTWGPGPTTAELAAMDGSGYIPEYSAGSGYGPGTLVAQSGTLLVDFTMPDHTLAGSYFQLGIWYNYNNAYGAWWASGTIDLGPVSTPNGTMEMYQAIIPYSIISDSNQLSYCQFGIVENTDYQGANPWYVDNISVVPLVIPPTPPPVAPLFTTSNDFALFTSAGGDLVVATNDWSANNDATNGLGNTNAASAIGTAGSLLLYWSSLESGYGNIAQGPDEEYNAAFMQAIDPGCNPGTETSVPAYGNIYLDYSQPDNSGGGNYFQLGVFLSYAANGYYQTFYPSSTTDLHVQDNNGYEVYQATIPYTINAGQFYGFSLSVAVNSNYQPTNGFHVDNITVSAAQAPLITSTSLNGTSLILQGTNALGGYQFNLLSTTNLTVPLSHWSTVGAGIFQGPMTFSNTFTINPANSPNFYIIQTVAP